MENKKYKLRFLTMFEEDLNETTISILPYLCKNSSIAVTKHAFIWLLKVVINF